MTPRLVHEDDEKVYACPECDSANPHERVKKNTHDDTGLRCACYNCGARFEDPILREPKKTGHRLGGRTHEIVEKLRADGGTARDEKDSRHPGQGITQDRDVEDARPYYDGGAHAE